MNSELRSKRSKITDSDYAMYKSILSKEQKIDDITQFVFAQEYDPITVSRVLRKAREKEIADKFFRRVLRLFRAPQINLR